MFSDDKPLPNLKIGNHAVWTVHSGIPARRVGFVEPIAGLEQTVWT